jgi:hypothetical protein
MPLSTESIQNKPLSGRELIEVIVNDVRDLLQRDGMFSPYVAYRRVAYSLDVRVYTGNPMHPEHTARVRSHPGPEKSTESFPLADPVEGKGEMEVTRDRDVDSPNLTRIGNSLPITTYVQEQGKTVQKTIEYQKGLYPEPAPPTDTVRGSAK